MADKSDRAVARASIDDLLTAAGCHPDHAAEVNDMLMVAEFTVTNCQPASAVPQTAASTEIVTEEDGCCVAEAAEVGPSDSQD